MDNVCWHRQNVLFDALDVTLAVTVGLSVGVGKTVVGMGLVARRTCRRVVLHKQLRVCMCVCVCVCVCVC